MPAEIESTRAQHQLRVCVDLLERHLLAEGLGTSPFAADRNAWVDLARARRLLRRHLMETKKPAA